MRETRIAPRAAARTAARPGEFVFVFRNGGRNLSSVGNDGPRRRTDATWDACAGNDSPRPPYGTRRARLRRVRWDPRATLQPRLEVELGATRDSTRRGVGVRQFASAPRAPARPASRGRCRKGGRMVDVILFLFS